MIHSPGGVTAAFARSAVLDLPERRERGRVTGDLIRQRVTGHLEVDVRVDEPRYDRAAGGVKPRRRARLTRHLVGRADQRDPALSDEDRLGGRLVILERDDAPVDDGEIASPARRRVVPRDRSGEILLGRHAGRRQ